MIPSKAIIHFIKDLLLTASLVIKLQEFLMVEE